MECTSCQATNPDQSIFCIKCGQAISRHCPRYKCRKIIPLEAEFCNHCGINVKLAEEANTISDNRSKIVEEAKEAAKPEVYRKTRKSVLWATTIAVKICLIVSLAVCIFYYGPGVVLFVTVISLFIIIMTAMFSWTGYRTKYENEANTEIEKGVWLDNLLTK